MSNFYSDLSVIMKECLAEFDCRTTKMRLVRHSGRVMNPVTRELDAGTETEIEVTGITIPFSKSQIDGSAILDGDIRVILDEDTDPQEDDDILIDGDNYSIVSKTTFRAGGVLLGFDLVVRR